MSITWKRWYTPPLVIAGLLASAFSLWKWSPDVPKWAQQNTGPWVLAAAVIAFTGVWLTIRAQGHNADNDRRERREEAERAHERALEVARDERDAQERRAMDDRKYQANEAEKNREQALALMREERQHSLFRAQEDGKQARQLMRDERSAQENRARAQWFRDRQMQAYLRLLEANRQMTHFTVLRDGDTDEGRRILFEFHSATGEAAALADFQVSKNIREQTKLLISAETNGDGDQSREAQRSLEKIIENSIKKLGTD